MTEHKYGPDKKFGRTFGERSLLGDNNKDFFKKPILEQVSELAWSEGCPVRNKVINRKGPESARNRYGEVIFASQIVLAEAKEHNPELFFLLKQGLIRKEGEVVGEHESSSVPASHVTEISTSNTPWGYSLPRILIEQFGKGKERNQTRMIEGLEILESSIKKTDSPISLIAIFSEGIVRNNPSITNSVLKQAFSKGYLEEENIFEIYGKLLEEIGKYAPTLYKRYNELSSEEKSEKGIAEL